MKEIPLIGLGTWDLRGGLCTEIVQSAVEDGYHLIDTARMYGNEREVGEGIRYADRENLFITSKVCSPDLSYAKTKKAVEESLTAMGLEYIDLYLIHEPYASSGEMYRALEDMVEEGKVRQIGVSNFNKAFLESFLPYCRIRPAVDQVETHVYFQREELQEYLREQGILMQAWSPLAAGKNHIFSDPVLHRIAENHSVTAAQAALKYLLQKGIGVIPKTSKKQRLQENLHLDFTLTENEMQQIKSLDTGRSSFGWYEL